MHAAVGLHLGERTIRFLAKAGNGGLADCDVLAQLLAEGKTMKEAAALMGISTRTAESHKYEIMRQLGVQTTAELIRYAVRIKLV